MGQQVDYSNGDSFEGSSKPSDPRAPPESFRPPLPWNPAGFQYQNSCLNNPQPALKTVCPSEQDKFGVFVQNDRAPEGH